MFEKQVDLEEAKAQETAKLQETLHAMQLQIEEANAMVIREREAARSKQLKKHLLSLRRPQL